MLQSKTFNNFRIYLPFLLLFGLIPYRIFGLFGCELFIKLCLSCIFLMFFSFTIHELVPQLLNTLVLQAFFFIV